MSHSIIRWTAAAALLIGGGLFSQANAAVAGPGSAPAVDSHVEKTARVCDRYGCRWVPGPGPRYYGRPYYGRPYYGPPRYYGRRCAWRVRPTPYGPRRVRVCW